MWGLLAAGALEHLRMHWVFKTYFEKMNVKHLSCFILMTCWNDHSLDVFGSVKLILLVFSVCLWVLEN